MVQIISEFIYQLIFIFRMYRQNISNLYGELEYFQLFEYFLQLISSPTISMPKIVKKLKSLLFRKHSLNQT